MKLSTLLFLIFTVAMLDLSGCSDDGPVNTDPEVEPPTAEAFNSLREAALDSRTQTQQFDAQDGISFTSQNGVNLNVPAGCLTTNGQPANGSATLEYVELFEKQDMLATNRPTMGVNSNGDKKMLISGGSFSMDVIQNGDTLKASCNNIELEVPGNLTGGADEDMKLWNGTTDANNNLTWEQADTIAANGTPGNQLMTDQNNYVAFPNNLGTINIDKFYSDPRPKTELKVELPGGYNLENSAVYLSFDDQQNALLQLLTFDESTNIVTGGSGQVPIGQEMHVIFVTQGNSQWRYAIKGVTVAENDMYTFTLSDTQLGTEQELTNALNALP